MRANINQLIGGATEETIIARVGEGIVSAIGSAGSHLEVLENPDRISTAVLARRLDSQTAFEIVSIDIADIDVGDNVGARLQADQAEADMRVARANAEGRRAMAVAAEQEMQAKIEETRAQLIEAEADVPKAVAHAITDGTLGIMDYYRLRNLQSDTDMRASIAGVGSSNGKAVNGWREIGRRVTHELDDPVCRCRLGRPASLSRAWLILLLADGDWGRFSKESPSRGPNVPATRRRAQRAAAQAKAPPGRRVHRTPKPKWNASCARWRVIVPAMPRSEADTVTAVEIVLDDESEPSQRFETDASEAGTPRREGRHAQSQARQGVSTASETIESRQLQEHAARPARASLGVGIRRRKDGRPCPRRVRPQAGSVGRHDRIRHQAA